MPETAIAFQQVSVAAQGGHTILRDITLDLHKESTTALLGRSGSGKTTLLRTVNGLVMPTVGDILVDGTAVRGSDLQALRRGIGYVIQESGLFPHMTVARNVGISAELEGIKAQASASRVDEVLRLVGLIPEQIRDRLPAQLSGGQRQRVGVARALMSDPSVLLLDEPFGALDPITRAEIQAMLRDLQRARPRTVLIITHDFAEALFLADRCLFLEDGRLAADLPVAEVESSHLPAVRQYVAAARHEAV